jgi:hypothetical protein
MESKIIAELEKVAKKPHKKNSIDFKLNVIKLSKMNIYIHSISNRLGIDRKIIRDWIKNEIILKNISNKDKKYRICKSSGVIKDFSDEEEEKIFMWIKEKRDNKSLISAKSILAYACSLKTAFPNKKIDV